MVSSASFTLSGAEDIQKALMELPLRLQKRGLNDAFKFGAQMVADEAKNLASGRGVPKKLINAIKVAKPTRRQLRDLVAESRSSTIYVIALEKPYSRLAHIFEYGTVQRFRNKSKKRRGEKGDRAGGSTGQILAKPFLRPALDTRGPQAIKDIQARLAENIELIASQMAKGKARISFRRVSTVGGIQ